MVWPEPLSLLQILLESVHAGRRTRRQSWFTEAQDLEIEAAGSRIAETANLTPHLLDPRSRKAGCDRDIEMFRSPRRKRTNNGMLSPVDVEIRPQTLDEEGVWETSGTSDRGGDRQL